MAPPLPLMLCLTTLLALAGCTDGGDAGEPDPARPEGQGAAPVGPGAPGSAAAAPVEGPAQPAVARCEGKVAVGTGVRGNFQSASFECSFGDAGVVVEDYGWALVEASWPGALPTSTAFYLYLLSDSCDFSGTVDPCWHATERSTMSTVSLVADPGVLDSAGGDGLRAWTGMDGAAVQQDVVLAITLVPEGQELPEGYSALP